MTDKPTKKQWKDYTPAERFGVIVFIGIILMVLSAIGGGTKSGNTTETDRCKSYGAQPYRGSADNDAVIQYLKECRGQTDEDIYGRPSTTRHYGY